MNPQPLVSIIIPTFNRAHLIGETLDSVLAQTYQNWECIIVDDGSSDHTDEVVGAYTAKDPRFKYYHRPDTHKPGGNGARNYGFEVSEGEYVNWLDSDDYLYKECISLKVKFALENVADVVISKHTRVFEDLTAKVQNYRVFESNRFYEDFILSRNSILIGDPFIKRNITLDVKFNPSLIRVQDHDYFARLFDQKILYCLIDAKLYFYDYSDGSITVRAGDGDKEMIDTQVLILKKMLSKYAENQEIVEEYKRKARKMYISLMKKRKARLILKELKFYSFCFNKNVFYFSLFFMYNLLFGRGYDIIKK